MPSNFEDDRFETQQIVSFRIPVRLYDIMQVEAKKELLSISDIGRRCVLKGLKVQGLIE